MTMNAPGEWVLRLVIALWLALVCICLFAGCAPKPLSVDELNAREQERLAKEAAAARTP